MCVSDPGGLTHLLLLLDSGSQGWTQLDYVWSGTSPPSWIKNNQLIA